MSDIATLLQPLQGDYTQKVTATNESYNTVGTVERLLATSKQLVSDAETARNESESKLVTAITSHLLGYARGVDKVNKVWDAHQKAHKELYEPSLVKDDKQRIKQYLENKAFPNLQQEQQEAYDAALARETEREGYATDFEEQNEALIVTRTNQAGTLEIYVSVPFKKRGKGLNGKVGEVVTALIPQGYDLSDAVNASGIVRYDVANGDEKLVKLLQDAKPSQLKHAGVTYSVVSVDELVGESLESKSEESSIDDAVEKAEPKSTKRKKKKKSPVAEPKTEVDEASAEQPVLERGQYLRDVADTIKTQDYLTLRRGIKKGEKRDIRWVQPSADDAEAGIIFHGTYVAVRDVQVLGNLGPSSTYKKFVDKTDDQSGENPIKTAMPGKARMATLESFLDTFGNTVVFNLDEASEIIKTRWKEVKGETITLKKSRKKLGDQKSAGKVAMLVGPGPERYVSQPEMERWMEAFVK